MAPTLKDRVGMIDSRKQTEQLLLQIMNFFPHTGFANSMKYKLGVLNNRAYSAMLMLRNCKGCKACTSCIFNSILVGGRGDFAPVTCSVRRNFMVMK